MIRILIFFQFIFVIQIYKCNSIDRNISTPSSDIHYKSYFWEFVDTFSINTDFKIDKLFNHNNSFRITPEGCISYYAQGNQIVKVCGDSIVSKKVFKTENTFLLANYYWISSTKIVFCFHPTYFNDFLDFSIFTFDFEKGVKETSYNFEGSNLIYSKASNLDSMIKNRSSFDNSYSLSFVPIYDSEDSSLIIPITPSYHKRVFKDNLKEGELLNTETLVKIYPTTSGKKAQRLPIYYNSFLNKNESIIHNNQYYSICNYYDSKRDKILMSTNISNKIIEYSLSSGEMSLLIDDNLMLTPTIGFDSVPRSDNYSKVSFTNIFYNESNNSYFRQVLMPLNFGNGRSLNFMVYGLIIMDSNFKEVGFAHIPKGYKIIGIDNNNNFVMQNLLEVNFSTNQKFIYGNLSSFEVIKGYVSVPEEYVSDRFTSDFNKYLNSINIEISKYENVIILPFDNTCPACVNKMKTFLNLSDSLNPKTALVIIFKNHSSYMDFYSTFSNIKMKNQIFFDYQNKYIDVILLPDRFTYIKKSISGVFEFEKDYIPSTIGDLIDFLSVYPLNIGPTCIKDE